VQFVELKEVQLFSEIMNEFVKVFSKQKNINMYNAMVIKNLNEFVFFIVQITSIK
jgi:hypothetical protein